MMPRGCARTALGRPARHRRQTMNHSEPSGGPLLSVVMPVHNEADYVGDTLRALRLAVTDANLDDDMELIIVDDGSTDESATVAESTWGKDLSLLTQPNRGRFESRRRGTAAAHGRHVLALDARSVLEVGSLAFWTEQRDRHPGRRLWNGDTRIQSDVNPYARFWEVLTGIGWGEYTRNPRLVSFGAADFDRFPKGTGMFLAPRVGMAGRLPGCRGTQPRFPSTALGERRHGAPSPHGRGRGTDLDCPGVRRRVRVPTPHARRVRRERVLPRWDVRGQLLRVTERIGSNSASSSDHRRTRRTRVLVCAPQVSETSRTRRERFGRRTRSRCRYRGRPFG